VDDGYRAARIVEIGVIPVTDEAGLPRWVTVRVAMRFGRDPACPVDVIGVPTFSDEKGGVVIPVGGLDMPIRYLAVETGELLSRKDLA